MKRISILNQQDSKLLFSVEDYGVYFLMPLEDLGRLSELSYECLRNIFPTVAVLLILSACLQTEVCAIGRMPFKFTNHGLSFFSFMLYYSTIQRQVPFLPCWMLPFCMTNTVKG